MTSRHLETFWDRLADAMKDRGIKVTQKSAGALVGLTQTGARKWQHGTLPSVENCVTMAQKLGVTVEWLYTGRGMKRPIEGDQGDEDMAELIELFKLMDDERRQETLGYARYARTVSFKGDPEKRSKVQQDLVKNDLVKRSGSVHEPRGKYRT